MTEPPKKRQRTNDFSFNVAAFAADEADEGADDEEWDDDIDDDVDDAELERHRRDVEARYARRHEPTLNQDILNGRRHDSMPNILDRLQQKYANNQIYNDDAQSMVASEYGTSHHGNVASTMYAQSSMGGQQGHGATSSISASHRVHYPGQSSISVEATLPNVQDPNLWLVPCLPGKERFAVEELLKKYFKYINHQSKKLFIKTAFTTDMNTGYIYVEAYKEIHVRRACEDISGLNTWKLRLVPRNEMVDALTIKAAGPQIKRGQWCRFQRGLYKGDLAQVYAIMDQGSKVVLRVVPRIDYGRLSMEGSNRNDNGRYGKGNTAFMRKGRPPQKLFNKQEIEMYEEPNRAPETISKDNLLQTRIIRWRGKKYKNGYHLVTMPVNQVEFDVTAAPEEVQLLRAKTGDDEDDDDGDDDMMEVAPPIFQKTCQFVRGDTVKVVRGAMTNLIGEVLTTAPNPVTGKITVTVLPEHKDLMEAIMFPADELQKYFKVGCHVKVKRGKYKDETGLIIKVEEEEESAQSRSTNKKKGGESEGNVIIFSDLTSRTIRVHSNDITETSEVSTGRDVLGNYALYELVHLSRDVVGVIVSIQNGTFQILDNKDQIQTCRLPDIARHSRDEHAVALDIDNNQIRLGDVIIPQVGDFKSQRATVKHVYRSVLFCHTKSCTVNSGIFVCRSRLCRLAGGRMRMNNSSISQQGRSDTKNDRRLRILHKHRSSRDPWMHKTVKVKRGSYKGMIGIVCGCTDQKLHIELHAKCKKIQVKREDVKVINQDGTDIDDNPYNSRMNSNNGRNNNWRGNNNNNNSWRGNNNRGNNGNYRENNQRRRPYRAAQTPLIGVQTPAYGEGAATPAIGSQTPAMGSQTPGYGGVTPAYGSSGGGGNSGSAWNVGGITPAHNPQTPSSPLYGDGMNPPPSTHSYSHTPSHGGGITPSHHPGNGYNNNSGYNDNYNNHNHNNNNGHHNDMRDGGDSGSNNSESEHGDADRAMQQDPYYFIIENALLEYNRQSIIIKSVDRNNGCCDIALADRANEIYQTGIPLSHIVHTVPHDLSSARVKVVWGKLSGEIGSLIGIDNDEAVVQLTATTEVTIINKRLVVVYVGE